MILTPSFVDLMDFFFNCFLNYYLSHYVNVLMQSFYGNVPFSLSLVSTLFHGKQKNPECIRFNCMPESAPWKWFVGWPIEQSMTISGIEILQSMTRFCQCFWKAAGILLFWTKHLLNKYRQEGKTRKILITDPLWYTKETAC